MMILNNIYPYVYIKCMTRTIYYHHSFLFLIGKMLIEKKIKCTRLSRIYNQKWNQIEQSIWKSKQKNRNSFELQLGKHTVCCSIFEKWKNMIYTIQKGEEAGKGKILFSRQRLIFPALEKYQYSIKRSDSVHKCWFPCQ